jgi:hypothetical protein
MTKLEAREKTGDILAEIDDLIDSVNHTSARMRFERLLPTCEIGDEMAERFLESGFPYPSNNGGNRDETIARWNTIGRQCEFLYCDTLDCECKSPGGWDRLRGKDNIVGLSQPHILDNDDFDDFQNGHRELSRNDQDALNYMIEFMGRDFVRVGIDYDRLAIGVDELFEDTSNDESEW